VSVGLGKVRFQAERFAQDAAPPPVEIGRPLRAPLAKGGRDYRLRRMLATADVLALAIAITAWPLIGGEQGRQHALWAIPFIPVFLVLLLMSGSYSPGSRRVAHSMIDDIPALWQSMLLGSVGLWLYFQVTPADKLRFGDLLVFAAVAFAGQLAFRSAARGLAARWFGPERVLFVGSGPMTPVLVRQICARPSGALTPVGALTREENLRWPLAVPSLGELAEVDPAAVITAQHVDRVMVSAEGIEDAPLLDLIEVCRGLGVKISALPSLAAMIGPGAMIDHLDGITLIGINPSSLARSSRYVKRAMDIVGSALLLLLTLPLWIGAAIAVKLDSRGPILFRQERVGRGGRRFKVAKFRSMVVDAEEMRAVLLAESRQEGWLDLEDDPRITRVGRFLRHTSLDELPQLWNVFRGDMSLVGPRPLIPEEDENVSGWGRARLDLTPGITGMWQVLGRVCVPFEQMVMIDYLYVANWSLWTDIQVLLRTLPVVLMRRGAN
jgi:exopolysaccharide biosynthesis polyprenyl glycosylphosphotransferase